MVTDGTGSADSTICCVEPISIRVIPTQIEKPPKHLCTPAASIPNRQSAIANPLSHPEGIERRLIDRRRRGEPLIGLVGGERLAGQRPEQSIHVTPVIAHLLQHGLHVGDHLIRRLSAVTHIDRSVVGIIFGRRIVTPCRIPVAVVPEVVTATDQLHAVVTRPIPALIVPFGMIRAEHFILRTLPLFASLNPIILVEGNRRNLLRLWLRTEVRVLRFDLLHLLRIRLLRCAHPFSSRVLLAGCRHGRSCTCRCRWRRSCACRSRRLCRSSTRRCLRVCGRRFHSFLALLRLLLGARRRTGGRLTGNVPLCTGGDRRLRRRLALLPLWHGPLVPRSALLRGRGLRLRRVRPLRRLGRVRLSRSLLVLWCRLFVWLF